MGTIWANVKPINIPSESVFPLVTQCERTGNNQLKIYMANSNSTLACQKRTIFHWLTFGLTLGSLGFALGLRGFLDTNILVWARVGVYTRAMRWRSRVMHRESALTRGPNVKGFSLWWNIGLSILLNKVIVAHVN